jgi:hypothetical protein
MLHSCWRWRHKKILRRTKTAESRWIFLGSRSMRLPVAAHPPHHHSPIGSPSLQKNSLQSSVQKWKMLACSVNPMEDKKQGKKSDCSLCGMKTTKHKSSMDQSVNFCLTHTGETSAAVAEGTTTPSRRLAFPAKRSVVAVVTPAQEHPCRMRSCWIPLASGTNMPLPTCADRKISNQPFGLPCSVVLASAVQTFGMPSNFCAPAVDPLASTNPYVDVRSDTC